MLMCFFFMFTGSSYIMGTLQVNFLVFGDRSVKFVSVSPAATINTITVKTEISVGFVAPPGITLAMSANLSSAGKSLTWKVHNLVFCVSVSRRINQAFWSSRQLPTIVEINRFEGELVCETALFSHRLQFMDLAFCCET